MYLPTEVAKEREAITKAFFEYRRATARALWDKYGAFEHWAKIEVGVNSDDDMSMVLEMMVRRGCPRCDFKQNEDVVLEMSFDS